MRAIISLGRAFFCVILVTLLAGAIPVFAEPILFVKLDSPDAPSTFTFFVSEYNLFEDPSLNEDDLEDSQSVRFVTKGSDGSVIGERYSGGYKTGMLFSQNIASISLFSGDTLVVEKKVSFCDKDKVCEPCLTGTCLLSENALTCLDCSSGAKDGFCNTVDDGVCDPDCGGDFADPDCERFSDYYWVDENYGIACKDYDGVECGIAEDCLGGYFVSAGDSDNCCVGGRCAVTGEYVAYSVALQNQPALVYTATGVPASSVIESGIADYCGSRLKGSFCGIDEHCFGSVSEYYPGISCCVGSCIPYVPSEFGNTPAELEEGSLMLPPGPSDFEDYAAEKAAAKAAEDAASSGQAAAGAEEVPPVEYPPEILTDLPEGEFPHESIADIGAEKPFISQQTVEDVRSAVSEVTQKVDVLSIVVIIFIALLAVLIGVAVYRKVSSRKSDSGAGLQQSIDSFVAQGYNYMQIQSMLVQKGFNKDAVDYELKRNYEKRAKR